MAQVGYVESQASTYIWGRLVVTESRSGTTSTVTAKLQVKRTNSYSGTTYQYGTNCKYTITIDGTSKDINQTASSHVVIPANNNSWITVGSATKSISHTAAKSITCSWKSSNMGSYLSCSGSCKCTLAAFITKITASISSVTSTSNDVSAYINWTAQSGATVNIACEVIDNNSSYVSTIRQWTSQSPGNTYSLSSSELSTLDTIMANNGYLKIRWTLKTLISGTAAFSDSHDYDYYRTSEITVSPTTFDIGDSVSIYITRQRSTLTHYVSVSLGSWSKTIASSAGTSATWSTATDRTSVISQSPSGGSVSGTIRVSTYAGSTYVGARSVSIRANMVNDPTLAPSFSNNFEITDDDAETVAITGTNAVLVKGKSNIKVSITTANAMQPKYNATGSSYSFQYGTTIVTKPYSSTSTVSATLGTPTEAGTNSVTVRALDSRQYYADATKNFTVIDYGPPDFHSSVTRLNGFENQTTLQLNATFSTVTVNNVAKNTILAIQYRYKNVRDSWGSDSDGWQDIEFTISGDHISSPAILFNLDNTQAWDFQFRVTDRFGTMIVDNQLTQGVPIIGFYEDGRVSIDCVPTESGKGLHLADGDHIFSQIYPVGAIFESATITTSSEIVAKFGGYWSLVGTRTVSSTTIYTYRRTS